MQCTCSAQRHSHARRDLPCSTLVNSKAVSILLMCLIATCIQHTGTVSAARVPNAAGSSSSSKESGSGSAAAAATTTATRKSLETTDSSSTAPANRALQVAADLHHVHVVMSQAARTGTAASLEQQQQQLKSGGQLQQQQQQVGGTSSSMMQLVDCINSQYVAKNMTWAAAMKDEPASVKVAGAWWSAKARSSVPVTIVTQSTIDRIPQLYAQCKSWRGPISVVLYMPFVQSSLKGPIRKNKQLLLAAIEQVSAFFERVERDRKACQPDILLVYELFSERRGTLLYPINLLRNMARLQARTPLIGLMDADLLLSSSFYTMLLNKQFADSLVEGSKNKGVYVLPAFETYGEMEAAAALAEELVARDKIYLIDRVEAGVAGPYDFRTWTKGHNATNFEQWYRTDSNYRVTPTEGFEPWVIVGRDQVPWHDVRFRGYGRNKIQHIAHMNMTGFNFNVLANAYIVHRAHPKTKTKVMYLLGVGPTGILNLRGHTHELLDKAKVQMAQGRFEAVLDPATVVCKERLGWWAQQQQRQ